MEKTPEAGLPPIPVKRYFTIGEVAQLCGVKPHVLRYWEQEFTQLRPMKRRGNRRYYQHHEVLMIRRIRDLLYDQGFTISGARNKLQELAQQERERRKAAGLHAGLSVDGDDAASELDSDALDADEQGMPDADADAFDPTDVLPPHGGAMPSSGIAASMDHQALMKLRRELHEIRALLSESY
ncbi:MerR family transcriptional regulator [Xenophilus arseniciresistens]|uniref:MerR family transcriptional regulator n=1 Tax=Xenophilus arseniciresistens TaxID=1283306 RepID=A0AAE3SYI0_9BURK|nr:MerR family transcriptional regulator [Xenophilus arseniciresistens]MDA7416059.1 MerR family transcriptional regulator [Xenophilus arseniciresistens]